MKLLLTGAHGYIGSVAGPVLRAGGHEVIGLDVLYYEGCDLHADDDQPIRRADVRDLTKGDLAGFDGVLHLAALSNDPLGDLSPELTAEINFEATVQLAQLAREARVGRFVFASSCSMYGAAADGAAVTEEAPLSPLSAYAESKVHAERALAGLAEEGFEPVFARNATAYGVSPRLRLDLVLNNLAAWAFTTGRVRIMSDGTPWRPLVHIEDIARGALTFLEAPPDAVRGEAFNVGRGDDNHQVRDLAEIVRVTVGDCEIEYAGSGDPDPRSYRVDFGKLERTFPELELRWTASEGAKELVAAYREAGLTLDQFEGDRFVRLRRLRRLLDEGRLDADLRWQP